MKRRVRPGGKALARLRFFATQRGVPFPEPAVRPRPSSASRATGGAPPRPLRRTLAAPPARRQTIPYLDAFASRRRTRARAAALPRWRELGPRSIPRGQTYGKGGNNRPSVSGRIVSVAVDPANPRRILVASAGGGLWESRNDGRGWRPLTDDLPVLAMGALAFAPSDPRIVYAGTGEGDAVGLLGVGLLRSSDRGVTWKLIPHAAFIGQGFYDLAVDPADPAHLWAATTAGLFESGDSGARWRRLRGAITWDVSFDPASGELLAACADGLYRRAAGGAAGLVTLTEWPAGSLQRMEVCHAPSDGRIAYVFAATDHEARLWRREAPGGAFARQALPRGLEVHQAWYDWCAAVAPDDPDTLLIGAIELYRGVRRASGGWRWQNVSSRSRGDSIHPDHHHIAFAPGHPRTVYVGNDGGLYRSRDLAGRWESLNRGLGITEFEFLAQHPRNDVWILGGTQDNGTLRRSRRGTTWEQVALGDGGDCCLDDDEPAVCVHSYYEMGMELSTDAGRSWEWIGPDPPASYACLFYPPLEMRGEILAQAGESVFVTEDRGGTWDEIDLPSLPAGALASALAIPGPDEILVGTTHGHVLRIGRGPGGWTRARARPLATPRRGAYVSDIHVDTRGRIWVTYSTIGGGHVFVSRDGGASWRDMSGDLPSIPVNAIAVDPADSRIVFVGADNGVYRSTTDGGRWGEFGTGLPNAIVGDLLLHGPRRRLRAGTRNRGVWEIALGPARVSGRARSGRPRSRSRAARRARRS